ncbi:hypothetical protein [Companilactobacillus farciminis]|uniref:hypothetical protein n=1 Tax=Companilactobacillus farciminis TaxID=1612 RepID=UPI0023305E63|nr:hypothetical protein [Companilactobacillus farciminis]WCG35682.1 hypothetical protein PML84_00440 [Companilactobacillus farciminis]
MKKILLILVALGVILPLSACSVKSMQKDQSRQSKQVQLLEKNKQAWKKEIADADVIESDGLKGESTYVGTTLNQLKNHNQSLIKGTVVNLEKMHSPKNMAYTKATIHIDKVLSGDKTLQNKDYFVALNGGVVSFDRWYANMSKPKDFNHKMLIKHDEFPLPSIGSEIITGLMPIHLDEPLEYNSALKQSGFTIKNSFAMDGAKYNFWIRKPDTKKYQLNNPTVKKSDTQLAQELTKLTNEINRKYK